MTFFFLAPFSGLVTVEVGVVPVAEAACDELLLGAAFDFLADEAAAADDDGPAPLLPDDDVVPFLGTVMRQGSEEVVE